MRSYKKRLKEMNPNDFPLYAGIAGVSVNVNEFDFGEGVVLRKTYAHVMAPYLAAFAPAEPGKPQHEQHGKCRVYVFHCDLQVRLEGGVNNLAAPG